MKQMLFILNPKAGTCKANRYLTDILSTFNQAGYRVMVHVTAGPGDGAETVAKLASSVDLVVCCGGDGTFSETVNGVLRSGIQLPIGYIPAGSTNDFATSLHLPARVLDAAKAIVEGEPRQYDVGTFDERYFAYVASFGAFTRASYATPQSVKNALGYLAYILGGIQELSQIHKIHAKVEMDGQVMEDDFLFGAVSNSTSVGGVLKVDPKQVDMCDGKFEVLLVRAPKDPKEIPECLWALQNQKYNCSMITFCSASRICITADKDLPWTLDGEQARWDGQVEIKNLHKAISLIQKG